MHNRRQRYHINMFFVQWPHITKLKRNENELQKKRKRKLIYFFKVYICVRALTKVLHIYVSNIPIFYLKISSVLIISCCLLIFRFFVLFCFCFFLKSNLNEREQFNVKSINKRTIIVKSKPKKKTHRYVHHLQSDLFAKMITKKHQILMNCAKNCYAKWTAATTTTTTKFLSNLSIFTQTQTHTQKKNYYHHLLFIQSC